MKTTMLLRRVLVTLILPAAVTFAVACGSGDNNPTPTGGSGGSMIVGPASSSASSGTGDTTSSSTASGTGGATSSSSSGTGGGGGCFSGTPATNEDFLNACNGLTCQAFDNKGKLPLLNDDGTLPDLP
ncbi:Hypothetical protein A7982_04868 [Minicystis rosea]|nr:Hypothetical protein A7982_04868 [Minicystis rosea]